MREISRGAGGGGGARRSKRKSKKERKCLQTGLIIVLFSGFVRNKKEQEMQ
jgi:hypothetical protein